MTLTMDDGGGNTKLTEALGNTPRVRILEVLLNEDFHDLNKSDIARNAGLDRKTVYTHIDPLLEHNLVVQTRTAGNSPMYQINKDSEAAKALAKFDWELLTAEER